MKQFVFWTGVVSVVAGVVFQFPALSAALLPSESPGMLMHVFGLMALFLGIMLILSSRNLASRGPLVAWEGVLRVGGFCAMAGYGLFGGAGMLAVGSGVFDLMVGLVYLIGLPSHVGVSLTDLLLDRRS